MAADDQKLQTARNPVPPAYESQPARMLLVRCRAAALCLHCYILQAACFAARPSLPSEPNVLKPSRASMAKAQAQTPPMKQTVLPQPLARE